MGKTGCSGHPGAEDKRLSENPRQRERRPKPAGDCRFRQRRDPPAYGEAIHDRKVQAPSVSDRKLVVVPADSAAVAKKNKPLIALECCLYPHPPLSRG